MTDHRWLTLARTIASWPDSVGGFVVTRNDKIVIGTGNILKAMEHWEDCSVYYVPSSGPPTDDSCRVFNNCARLIIPDGDVLLGVSLDVEIEEVEL